MPGDARGNETCVGPRVIQPGFRRGLNQLWQWWWGGGMGCCNKDYLRWNLQPELTKERRSMAPWGSAQASLVFPVSQHLAGGSHLDLLAGREQPVEEVLPNHLCFLHEKCRLGAWEEGNLRSESSWGILMPSLGRNPLQWCGRLLTRASAQIGEMWGLHKSKGGRTHHCHHQQPCPLPGNC
jgi:hypothetical protein